MKKIISIALALLMVAVMLPVMAMAEDAKVAKIGEMEYATLQEAIDAVKDGEIITLIGNSTEGGIGIFKNDKHTNAADKSFTIDFAGYTLTVQNPNVGSAGTESQGLHLEGERDKVITFKNGTIKSNGTASMLIQNYRSLHLIDMEVDGSTLYQAYYGENHTLGSSYTMSNNCGDIVLSGKTNIRAKEQNGVAFDVFGHTGYPSGVSVTLDDTFTGTIDTIEFSNNNKTMAVKEKLTIKGNGTIKNISVPSAQFDDSNKANITISGGTFNTDVRPYVDSEFVVTDGNNYYVGDAAQNAVRNATSGELTVLNAGRGVAFNDVKPGVTIVNNSCATIIVNGNEVAPEKSYTVPGAPIIIYTPDNEPAILSGANQVVAPGAAATFRIDEEYDRLLAVAVDGVTLDKSNYEAWSGSTYIKLLPKFMKTLSVDTHTLTAYFTSHTVSTTFTISEGAKNPATGANDFVGVAAAMAVVSLLGAAAVIRKK